MADDLELRDIRYWRGRVDARLEGMDRSMIGLQTRFADTSLQHERLTNQLKTEMEKNLEQVQDDIAALSKLMYKIVGIGIILAALLPVAVQFLLRAANVPLR